MPFKKIFFLFFFMALIFFVLSMNYPHFYGVSIQYSSIFSDFFFPLNFLFLLDYSSLLFLLMVSVVGSMVTLYSEVYLEFYNNLKFILLLFIFFMSMVTLSFSGSPIILMVGWDGLGLASICLIMFYPNKITLYNSVLTMFFNRVGDLLMIFSICCFLLSPSLIFLLSKGDCFLFFSLLFLCSFTKSAQFPLSSWLPAAMSAPTPISAMVHSSTLVTAGIFIIQKFLDYMHSMSLSPFLCLVSMLTFFLGGFMANLERDYKKMVAFSTMSQISMVIFFCTMLLISLSLTHMMLHALFKTLLFCCAGVIFLYQLSNQDVSTAKLGNSDILLGIALFFSIFSMTGLLFSSSFFSKDVVLETFMMSLDFFSFLVLLLGSFLTLFYSSKLFSGAVSWVGVSNLSISVSFMYSFFLVFSFFTLYSGKSFSNLYFSNVFPSVSFVDSSFLLLLFAVPLVFPDFNLWSRFKFSLSLDISFMKFFSYSKMVDLFYLAKLPSISLNDHYLLKTHLLPKAPLTFTSLLNASSKLYVVALFSLLILLVY